MKCICVIDNAVALSSKLWGEHGSAWVIESAGCRILFDTGQSGAVLLHNLQQLGIDPASLDAIALSHAHYDHTGGLGQLLPLVKPGTPLYGNADLFRERYERGDAGDRPIGFALEKDAIARYVDLRLSDEPQQIAPGVTTSGRIRERREFEGRSPRHLMRAGDQRVEDEYRDDMALVLARAAGLAVLCGCCHAGLLNTLAQIAGASPRPVTLIMGGLHLNAAKAEDLERCGAALAGLPALQAVHPGHCSGPQAARTLARRLGPGRVHSLAAGAVIEV